MLQIEAMLADSPDDAFLRYGLAMEYVGQGEDAIAVEQFRALIALEPYVPAFLQVGQVLAKLGKAGEAMAILRQGMTAAQKAGDMHAHGEMQGLLESLE